MVEEKFGELEKLKNNGVKECECSDCGDSFPLSELRYARFEPRIVCENCYSESCEDE